MLYFEKEGYYIALIDHENAGVVIRRGKIGEIGTAKINSKLRNTEYGFRNYFYAEYKKILSEGYVLVRREELEESVKRMWPQRHENGTYEEKAYRYLKLLEIDPYSVYLYELAARYFLFDDMPEKALEQLKLSVKLDPLWQTSLYSMARIEASLGHKKEMLEYLQRAIEIQKLNDTGFEKLYTKEVFEDSLFQAYYIDTDFLKICPVAIKVPEPLVSLYNALIADDDLYLVIKLGEELLNQHPDKLAVLEPMAHALRSINSDLDEHGKNNLYQYGEGEHSVKYFAEYLKKVEDEMVNLINSGVTSTVYKDVMGSRN